MNRDKLIAYIKIHNTEKYEFRDLSFYTYAELVMTKVSIELKQHQILNIKDPHNCSLHII